MKRLIFMLLARILIIFYVAYLGVLIVPYKGFFPYADELAFYHLPRFITAFTNFDGLHYIDLASQGYRQYEHAFFPFYAIIIKGVSFIFNKNYLVSGLLVSYMSFIGGSIMLYRLIKSEMQGHSFWWVFVLLISFPTAFFFNALYTESLFFFLTITSLYFLKKKQFLKAGIFAAFSSATRLMGIFLCIPFLLVIVTQKKWTKKSLLFALFPFIGLGIYMIYLYITTHNPFTFISVQPIFGANRSDHFIFLPQVYYRYIKIFLFSSFTFQYYIAIVEFIFFNGILVLCLLDLKENAMKRNFFYIGLILFSLTNILIPTATGTLSSIPRYGLFSLSLYFYLARIKSVRIKSIIIGLFSVGQIILLALFVQGYFIS